MSRIQVKSDSIARRLILAKNAVIEAQQLVSNTQVDLNLMRAVWQADFALELAFPAFFDQEGWLPPPNTDKLNLRVPGLPDFLKEFEDKHLPNDSFRHLVGLAKKIHIARNNIQHQGITFSQTTSSEYVHNAKSILDKLSSQFLKVSFNKVNLSLLNNDLGAQEYFDEALKCLEEEKYFKSARAISIAYKIGYENLVQIGSNRVQNHWNLSLESQISEIFREDNSSVRDSSLGKAIFALTRPLGVMQFGVDLNTAMNFFNLLPGVMQALGGTWRYLVGHRRRKRILKRRCRISF
jgi:hypothetical protein